MNKEVLTRSGGAWRANRLQWSSVASSRRQDEVITAGGRRNGVVSKILWGFLRFLRGAGLFEVHAIQGFITVTTRLLLKANILCNCAIPWISR
jgi:hypothetical protein